MDGSDREQLAIETRADALVNQDWWSRLIAIEGSDAGQAWARFQDEVAGLGRDSELRLLAERYVRCADDLQRWRYTGRGGWRLAGVVLAMLGAVAVSLVGIPVAAPAGIALAAWIYRMAWRGTSRSVKEASAELARATTDLDRRIRSLLEDCARPVTRLAFVDPGVDATTMGEGVHLSSRATARQRIASGSRAAIELHLLRAGGAAVGVTGERGIGKSELLRSFCGAGTDASIEDGGTIGVFVPVPSAYRGVDFLRLLARRLIEAVPGYLSLIEREAAARRRRYRLVAAAGGLIAIVGVAGLWAQEHHLDMHINWWKVALVVGLGVLGLASALSVTGAASLRGEPGDQDRVLRSYRRAAVRHAADLMRRIRYIESLTAGVEGSVALARHGLGLSRSRTRSELPLTEADLVAEFGALTDELEMAGYRVVVALDEMDKLEGGEATEEFLNSVKQIFAVRSCSFLVSVSSSAWVQFIRRGVDLRGALDSSLDAVEVLAPFTFLETRSLIRHRGERMSDSQVLLCHVLSGGIPREALRCARQVVYTQRRLPGHVNLTDIAAMVVEREAALLFDGLRARLDVQPPDVRRAAGAYLGWLRNEWTAGDPSPWTELPRPGHPAPASPQAAEDGAAGSFPDEVREALYAGWLYCAVLRGVKTLFSRSWSTAGTGTVAYVPEAASELVEVRRLLESEPVRASSRLHELGLIEAS
jgi:hypothetical protein